MNVLRCLGSAKRVQPPAAAEAEEEASESESEEEEEGPSVEDLAAQWWSISNMLYK